jgi:hypothetical protein
MEKNVGPWQNPITPLGVGSGAGFGVTPAQSVVVAHFDTHGVCAGYLAAKAFNATEVFANYPETSPETLIQTLQNLYAAAPSRLRIIIVDVPVNLKDPVSFVQGLENLATRHEIYFFDHHETSLPYLTRLARARAFYAGPSALTLNETFLRMIPNPTETDQVVSIVGAIGDRDSEVVKRGLFSNDLQSIADGLDVLVRERNGALSTLKSLISDPMGTLARARSRANEIPVATMGQRIGPVVLASERLPAQWGPKALERLAFQSGAWYAVGYGYDERSKTWIVRSIIRWDVSAKIPSLPQPGTVARSLWTTRNIIGHPSAPSVAATSEEEARMMVEQLARSLADVSTSSVSPSVQTFISESRVGQVFTELLQRIEQILENQNRMYQEYLELKRRQVELLSRGERRVAD